MLTRRMVFNVALVILSTFAALGLIARLPQRRWGVTALAVCALELAVHFGQAGLFVRGANVWTLLGAALVVTGAGAWAKATTKAAVSCATILLVTGLTQVLMGL